MNKTTEQILKDHFLGRADEKQEAELQHWRDKNDYNDEEYLRLREAWNKDRSLDNDLPEDEKWRKFKKKHFKPDSKTRILRRKSIIKYSLILLVFIALSATAIYYSGSDVYRTTMGERQLVTLEDGSKIWLREDSRLTVGRIFAGFERDVNLDGSAIFELEPNSQQTFTALGSKSMARGNGGLWLYTATDSINKLQVLEGLGHFWIRGKGDTIQVDQGEKAVVVNENLVVRALTGNEPTWYTGHFNFDNTPLSEALTCLQDHYRVNLKMKENLSLNNCEISGTFEQPTLIELLDSIESQVGMKYQVSDQTINVTQVQCQSS